MRCCVVSYMHGCSYATCTCAAPYFQSCARYSCQTTLSSHEGPRCVSTRDQACTRKGIKQSGQCNPSKTLETADHGKVAGVTGDISTWPIDVTATFLNTLIKGSTGNKDEESIIKVWKCLDSTDRSRLMREHGFTYALFDGEIQGDAWHGNVDSTSPLWPGMKQCLPLDISSAAVDDDWARAFVNTRTKRMIADEIDQPQGVENIAYLLKGFIKGTTGTDDEHSIIKVIEALTEFPRCELLRKVRPS